jgi:hypothetical protein
MVRLKGKLQKFLISIIGASRRALSEAICFFRKKCTVAKLRKAALGTYT